MSVFISYNWRAKAFAEAIAALLASQGITYWRDDEHVRPGDNLFQLLAEGLAACTVVLVLLTPEYVGSENCAREVQLAAGYHKPLLVLRLPGIAFPPPPSAGAYAAQIAFALSGNTYLAVDGVTPPAGELLPALTALGIASAPPSTPPPPPRPLLRTIPWELLQATADVRGNGTYGTVRVYTWTSRGSMKVAVKELSRAAASVLTTSDIAAFHREASLQAQLEHDHVARVYALAEGEKNGEQSLGLVMKLYQRPVSAVLGRGQLPLATRAAFVLQVASGLAYMHGEGVVHGDLKPDNVLLASGGTEVALTDFGCSTLKLAGSMTSGTNKGAGTAAFKAPELFEEDAEGNPANGVSRAADVYAFGVTAWCMLADCVAPYPLRNAAGVQINVARRVPAGMRPGEGVDRRGVPTEWLGLLERCWVGSAAARPEMVEVLALVKGIVGHDGEEGLLAEAASSVAAEGSAAFISEPLALLTETVPEMSASAILASDVPIRGAIVELRDARLGAGAAAANGAAAVGLDAPPLLIGGGAVQQSTAPAALVQQAQGIQDDVGAPSQFIMGNASVEIPTGKLTPAKIVELLRAGGLDATVAEQACKAVGRCTINDDDRQACLTAGVVSALVAVLTCHFSMPAVAARACRELCQIASCNDARQEACVAAGVLPALVAVLTSQSSVPAVGEQACRALLNIASCNHSCQEACVAAGVLPVLVAVLTSQSSVPAVAEQACLALDRIATCNPACQEACVAAGAVPALLTTLTTHSKDGAVAKAASEALAVIAENNPSCKAASIVSAAVPALLAVLANHPVKAAHEAQRALLSFSSSDPACREIFVAAGAVPVLVQMCSQKGTGSTYGPIILRNLGYNKDGTLK